MRSVRRCSSIACVAILITLSAVASASAQQTQPAEFYVTGSLAIPTQGGPTREVPATYIIPFGPGGTTVGWKAGFGYFLLPRASLDIELVGTGQMGPLRERLRYDRATTEERRDFLTTIGARFHWGRYRRIQLHPSAGFLLAHTVRWSQAERLDIFRQLHISPRERSVFLRFGWTAGIDLSVGGNRFRAGPSLRLHHVRLASCYTCGFPGNGLWEWSFTPGMTAMLLF
jgi:hypothetical protein